MPLTPWDIRDRIGKEELKLGSKAMIPSLERLSVPLTGCVVFSPTGKGTWADGRQHAQFRDFGIFFFRSGWDWDWDWDWGLGIGIQQ